MAARGVIKRQYRSGHPKKTHLGMAAALAYGID